MQGFPWTVIEEATDGVFARMAEGRVAEVMGQTSCGDDVLNVGQVLLQFRVFDCQFFHCTAGDRASDAGHLEAVGEAVVDHLCAWQRKNLCLVLQTAERA